MTLKSKAFEEASMTLDAIAHRRMLSLWDALEFMDKCRSQPNSGETGAYRDAVEWIESAARDACSAHFDLKTAQIQRAKGRKCA
jgi:hypothetical protein